MSQSIPFDPSILTEAVNNTGNIRDAIVYLGLEPTIDNYKKFKSRCARHQISTHHFMRAKPKTGYNAKVDLKDALVENSTYLNIGSLKKRLVASGLMTYACSECHNPGEWNGKPLTLQLDHINGDRTDHRLTNLRFLCPNCHAQTDTYAGRNASK